MSSVTMLVVCPYQWCTCFVSFAVRAKRKLRVIREEFTVNSKVDKTCKNDQKIFHLFIL